MTRIRPVTDRIIPQAVIEGAGVRLRRSIATQRLDYVDPFLLFDHFGSDKPEDYIAGFPMHPHRGIETVTYMLGGRVAHKDSMGNAGVVGPGDVQWMTAGSGILHEEMPRRDQGRLDGFQIWVNLPARLKMTRPRYQDVPSARIPVVKRDDGVQVRVIAGSVDGVTGAVTEIYAAPEYLDVTMPPGTRFTQPIVAGHTALAYLFEGEAVLGGDDAAPGQQIGATQLCLLGDGDLFAAQTGDSAARFLLLSGKPLGEPIARHGPFVMNTRDEIQQALRDLAQGTFIKN
ncbi:MAG: pirin family protein [Pseudomonadota bacterium]